MAGRTTGNKRQREMLRKERQAQKLTRRDERRTKVSGGDGIDFIDPVTGELIEGTELPGAESRDEDVAANEAASADEAAPANGAAPANAAKSANGAVPTNGAKPAKGAPSNEAKADVAAQPVPAPTRQSAK